MNTFYYDRCIECGTIIDKNNFGLLDPVICYDCGFELAAMDKAEREVEERDMKKYFERRDSEQDS